MKSRTLMCKCKQTFLMTTGMMLMPLEYVGYSTVPSFKVLLAAPLTKKIQMYKVYTWYKEKKEKETYVLSLTTNPSP